MRTAVASSLSALALGQALACGAPSAPPEPAPETPAFVPPSSQPGERNVAVLRIRDLGEIRIELLAEKAPGTVESFTKLAREGFYAGTTFHRVIPEFMIQGGDPNSKDRDPRNDGRGGPGYTIEDEFNDVAHVRGVVAMANTGLANSGGSQFFILTGDARHLDGKHAAFGLVVDGMEVVDRIAASPRDVYGRHGPRDRPLEDVVVESVEILPAAVARAENGAKDA